MQPLSLPEFRRLLRAQDAESLLDLVCALRRARGDDCTLREGVVEATNPRAGEFVGPDRLRDMTEEGQNLKRLLENDSNHSETANAARGSDYPSCVNSSLRPD